MFYYINGKFVDSSIASISFNDSGFLYGDGLFETLRFDNKKLFAPCNHINRLIASLKIIALDIQQSKDFVLLV